MFVADVAFGMTGIVRTRNIVIVDLRIGALLTNAPTAKKQAGATTPALPSERPLIATPVTGRSAERVGDLSEMPAISTMGGLSQRYAAPGTEAIA